MVCFSVSGENLTCRLRSLAFRAMLRQEVAWFDDERNSTRILNARLATDASKVQGVSAEKLVFSYYLKGNICSQNVLIMYTYSKRVELFYYNIMYTSCHVQTTLPDTMYVQIPNFVLVTNRFQPLYSLKLP